MPAPMAGPSLASNPGRARPGTAAGYGVFDLADGGWAADLCTIWDLDPGLLPAIAPAIAQAGGLQPHAASLLGLPVGTPVHVGAADSVAGAFALGGTCPAAVCVMMGSSTGIIARAESPSPDFSARFLLTPHALPGQWGIEMDLLATGTGYGWLTGLLRPEAGDLDALAALSVPGARGLVFAPYLAGGEQGALWDPLLTGVLHGLTLAHGAADIARAFLEGVQFEIRRCLDVLAEFGPLSQVFVSGGVTRHPGTLQMLADITGRAVTPSDDPSPAARGAALLAGASHASLLDAKLPIFPSPGATEYAPLYRRYLDLCPRVARPPSG
jgi:xylulokinase